jgi:hypothetical protein
MNVVGKVMMKEDTYTKNKRKLKKENLAWSKKREENPSN